MSKQDYVNHEGIITAIDIEYITVEILNKSACSSCHAKGVCTLGDVKVKEVDVENTGYETYELGEKVNLLLKRTLGYRALWLSYLVPLLILLVLLVSLSTIGFTELAVGLSIIGAISLYYIIIWLFRDKLKREFVFIIEKLSK
ncbi:MAG: SoxR reducing system RseC family protein [Bacteroidales bacterium]|nr:SoxR reducing system RseC family protein [Bacteroidales bacterium]